MEKEIGSVEIGKFADFVITEENPLANLKTLYGTGAIKLTENNEVTRVGGVKYTVKDGIVYDAKKLLADVRNIVAAAKKKENFEITQPGMAPKSNAGKLVTKKQKHSWMVMDCRVANSILDTWSNPKNCNASTSTSLEIIAFQSRK